MKPDVSGILKAGAEMAGAEEEEVSGRSSLGMSGRSSLGIFGIAKEGALKLDVSGIW